MKTYLVNKHVLIKFLNVGSLWCCNITLGIKESQKTEIFSSKFAAKEVIRVLPHFPFQNSILSQRLISRLSLPHILLLFSSGWKTLTEGADATLHVVQDCCLARPGIFRQSVWILGRGRDYWRTQDRWTDWWNVHLSHTQLCLWLASGCCLGRFGLVRFSQWRNNVH